MQTFSERVRWARGVSGLSQRRLSWVAGLSPAAVRVIETTPACSPEGVTLLGLSRSLGVSVSWLLEGGPLPSERTIKRAAAVAERPADAPVPKPRKKAA